MTSREVVPVTISGVAVCGDFAQSTYYYQCSNPTYFPTLAPNQSCSIYLVFAPTATGVRTGTLTITSNATTSPQSVPLSGKGVPNTKTLLVNPTGLVFTDQPVNTTKGATDKYTYVTQTNTGSVPRTLIEDTVTGDFAQ